MDSISRPLVDASRIHGGQVFSALTVDLSRELIARARLGGDTLQEIIAKDGQVGAGKTAKASTRDHGQQLQVSHSAPNLLSQQSGANKTPKARMSHNDAGPFGGAQRPEKSFASNANFMGSANSGSLDGLTSGSKVGATGRASGFGARKTEAAGLANFKARLGEALGWKVDLDYCEQPFWRTAFWEAIWKGHTEIARLLLASGASVGVPDYQGRTPLHEAAYYGRSKLVAMLLEHGHPIDCVDKFGQTPLFRAVEGGRGDVVKMLVEQNAQTNIADSDGLTVQHAAAFKGLSHMSHFLMCNGAWRNRFKLSSSSSESRVLPERMGRHGVCNSHQEATCDVTSPLHPSDRLQDATMSCDVSSPGGKKSLRRTKSFSTSGMEVLNPALFAHKKATVDQRLADALAQQEKVQKRAEVENDRLDAKLSRLIRCQASLDANLAFPSLQGR